MAKLRPKAVAAARLRGLLYATLQSEGFLSIATGRASEDAIRARFGVAPAAFWNAVRALESERSARVAPDGIYFVPPEERW